MIAVAVELPLAVMLVLDLGPRPWIFICAAIGLLLGLAGDLSVYFDRRADRG
jgi:hypothetical protein